MPTYLTPGVYFERPDAAAPPVDILRTDVAAFVGFAEHGPLHTPVAVQSWRQFQSVFGDFAAPGFLAFTVRGFFDNGGRRCHVVRVAAPSEAVAAAAGLNYRPTAPAWRIEAFSPGVWGNRLSVLLRATRRAQTQTLPETPGDPSSSPVASTARFEPGTLVKLAQGLITGVAIVAEVDGTAQRLIWDKAIDPAFRLNKPIAVESVEYTLTVFRDGRFAAVYEELSVVPTHRRYAAIVLADRFDPHSPRQTGPTTPPPLVVVREVQLPAQPHDLEATEENWIGLAGGRDGLAAVVVEDFTGSAADNLDLDSDGVPRLRGLRALEQVGDISLVAIPDLHFRAAPEIRHQPPAPETIPDPCGCDGVGETTAQPTPAASMAPEQPPAFSDAEILRIQMALVAHCETASDRFALLDPPIDIARDDTAGISGVLAWRRRFDSSYAGLYYPWIRVADPVLGGVRDVPPCGYVAGLYARTDLAVGVHKAPANDELQGATAPTVVVNAALQGMLNPQGINAIRAFPGRGVLLYGARTLGSNPAFRFVNVRRLLMMIEKALHLATQWAVFEPNDFTTRHKLRLAIETFLETLWRRGMLAGAQAQQAFQVKCDEGNNPPAQRDNGRLLAEIAVAPSIPSEFVVLRLGRTADAMELTVE